MINYIDIKSAAKILGIHDTNVRRFCLNKLKLGKDYMMIGKQYAINPEALKKYKPKPKKLSKA